jgi:hypothetical protein
MTAEPTATRATRLLLIILLALGISTSCFCVWFFSFQALCQPGENSPWQIFALPYHLAGK